MRVQDTQIRVLAIHIAIYSGTKGIYGIKPSSFFFVTLGSMRMRDIAEVYPFSIVTRTLSKRRLGIIH